MEKWSVAVYELTDDALLGDTLGQNANCFRPIVACSSDRRVCEQKPIRYNTAARQKFEIMEACYGDLIRQEFGIGPAVFAGDRSFVMAAGNRDADAR